MGRRRGNAEGCERKHVQQVIERGGRQSLGELIGRSVPRVEDARLLRGEGRYIDDIILPDMLHAVFARSRSAHARIKSIDTAPAKAVPGVHAVLLFADLRPLLTCDRIPLALAAAAVKFDAEPVCLASDEVCYVGEPIALVVADNRRTAEDAAALIEVDYDELPVVTDPRDGLAPGAPRARLDCPDNLTARAYYQLRRSGSGFRHGGAPAFRTVSHGERRRLLDRAARRDRALRGERRFADGVGRHADAASRQDRDGADARALGTSAARRRARCRRRLRPQGGVSSGGDRDPGGGTPAAPADQMDRRSARELYRHRSRAAADLGRRSRHSAPTASSAASAGGCITTTAPMCPMASRCLTTA